MVWFLTMAAIWLIYRVITATRTKRTAGRQPQKWRLNPHLGTNVDVQA